MAKDPIKAAKAAEKWRTDESYRQKSRDRKKRWYRKQRKENLEQLLQQNRQYRLARIDKVREHNLLKKYGLTWEAFSTLLEAQGNACAICFRPFAEYSDTRVDHCHTSSIVRGILCHGCNVGLGYFYDNSDALVSASIYLDRANERTSKVD